MNLIPERCVNCVEHKKTDSGTDYCSYIENDNGFAGTPLPYPNFYKQEYDCKGHKEKDIYEK